MRILENIHGHQDLIGLDSVDRQTLCGEIRDFLIDSVSKTGGHVASNLGVVELTVAIETVYNTAKDRLVFDVGHQSYVHKILTDRQKEFDHLRQFGGIAGFPKPSESEADAFVAGHASNAVSIALGMARARTMSGEKYDVVALLGDGAATGGLAYEGLNDASDSKEPLVIVLNDNTLSIDRNVGGMATHLRKLRTKDRYLGMKKKYRNFLQKLPGGRALYLWSHSVKDKLRRLLIPTTIFENMGLTYLGPVDGHDTEQLIHVLRVAKEMARPVVIHAVTQKGRGYKHSEEHPKLFHGVGKFDPESGEMRGSHDETFSAVFGKTMVELAEADPGVCAITAAMPGGTGLLDFKNKFPKRLFDVGIAEGHAVSMAGGLAKQGMVPVVALYSTFLQRAYDMILQDICLLGLHVVLAVDRAGLVGEDGETHHGVFDVSFLRQAPGMRVLCPGSVQELQDMLTWAIQRQNGPVAVRYPRGGDGCYHDSAWEYENHVLTDGALCVHCTGRDVMIITYGTLVQNALSAAELLSEQGIEASVVRLLTISPLPVKQLAALIEDNALIVVLEETTNECGVHKDICCELMKCGCRIRMEAINLGSGFTTHGKIAVLHEHCGLDAKSVANRILEVRQYES